MDSGNNERVYFKLGMMIDSTDFYILVLVYVICSSICRRRDARKQELKHLLSPKVINGFW